MSTNEEVKTNKIAITEAIEAKDTEKAVEAVPDEKDVKDVAEEVAPTVVDQVKAVVVEALGLKLVSESNLSEDQKKLAVHIYNTSSSAIKSIMSDKSLNNTLKVTRVIGQLIKKLENDTIDGHKPTGDDKKAVAIQLGRVMIKELVEDETHEKEILSVYDFLADGLLETMIDVSKVVNTVVKQAVNTVVEHAVTSCCPSFLRFFKKSA